MNVADAAAILSGEMSREARNASGENATATFKTVGAYVHLMKGLNDSVEGLLFDVELFTVSLAVRARETQPQTEALRVAQDRVHLLRTVMAHA